jgi:hypothetical protein
MEICPACGGRLVPFRAKLVCRTPGCGFMENCCDGGRMPPGLPDGGTTPGRRAAEDPAPGRGAGPPSTE